MQKVILLLCIQSLLTTNGLISMLQSWREDQDGSNIYKLIVPDTKKNLNDTDIFKQPYVIPEYDGHARQETISKLDESWHAFEIAGYDFGTEPVLNSSYSTINSDSSSTKEALSPIYRTTRVNIPKEKH